MKADETVQRFWSIQGHRKVGTAAFSPFGALSLSPESFPQLIIPTPPQAPTLPDTPWSTAVQFLNCKFPEDTDCVVLLISYSQAECRLAPRDIICLFAISPLLPGYPH